MRGPQKRNAPLGAKHPTKLGTTPSSLKDFRSTHNTTTENRLSPLYHEHCWGVGAIQVSRYPTPHRIVEHRDLVKGVQQG